MNNVSVAKLTLDMLGPLSVYLFCLIGYFFIDRSIFKKALLITLLAHIITPTLKEVFQHPLPATAGSQAYGFPSGHTLLISLFYFWIILNYKRITIRSVCSIVLIVFSIAIVVAGYHYPKDVLAALVVSLTTCLAFKRYIFNNKTEHLQDRTYGIIITFLYVAFVFVYSWRGKLFFQFYPPLIPVCFLSGYFLGKWMLKHIKTTIKQTPIHKTIYIIIIISSFFALISFSNCCAILKGAKFLLLGFLMYVLNPRYTDPHLSLIKT